MIKSTQSEETFTEVHFEKWSKEFREGWLNKSLDDYLPKGSEVTGVIVSGGQVVERIYTTPCGNIINLKMDHRLIAA